MTLSELGLVPSELPEEPSGPLALLSTVEFLRYCPAAQASFASKATLGCHPLTLTLEGRESGVSSAGLSDIAEEADLCCGCVFACVFSRLSPPPSFLPVGQEGGQGTQEVGLFWKEKVCPRHPEEGYSRPPPAFLCGPRTSSGLGATPALLTARFPDPSLALNLLPHQSVSAQCNSSACEEYDLARWEQLLL